jgi:hypothetical protein
MSSDDDFDGIEVVQSEQALRPAIDTVKRIQQDFERVTVGNEVSEITAVAAHTPDTSDLMDTTPCDGDAIPSTSADGAAATEGATAYDRTKEKYDKKYEGATVPVDGESDAAVVPGSAAFNTSNGDYALYPTNKKWGATLQYQDGTRLWKPLSDGASGVSITARLATRASTNGGVVTTTPRRSPRFAATNFLLVLMNVFALSATDNALTNAQLRNLPNPKTIWDCITAPDFKGWWAAARSEFLSWTKLHVFKIIDKSQRLRELATFPLQDIWTRKFGPDGSFSRFKLRLCIMGQLMKRDGIDCAQNVFALTVGASAVRLFFALAEKPNGATALSWFVPL